MMRYAIALLWAIAAGNLAAQTGAVEGRLRGSGVRAAGAVVYLLPEGRRSAPSPDSADMIDQADLAFVPRTLVVQPGATVAFRNSDPFLHNVFSPGSADAFDLGVYPRSESRTHTFIQLGPHVILCHVHPEMAAFVFVSPSPYHGVAGPDGRFRIEAVPPGRYTLKAWQRRARVTERALDVTSAGITGIELELLPGNDRVDAVRWAGGAR